MSGRIKTLMAMSHSPVSNYGGIPGLTSYLVGAPSDKGLVRLMVCSRDHQEPIVPHSHRFDFHCEVLSGSVRNIIWTRNDFGDEYESAEMIYAGEPGKYVRGEVFRARWATRTTRYEKDAQYSMTANEVHSIFFSGGTMVLFFEGPSVSDRSVILQPVVDGETIPTFKVEPWMFKRGAQ